MTAIDQSFVQPPRIVTHQDAWRSGPGNCLRWLAHVYNNAMRDSISPWPAALAWNLGMASICDSAGCRTAWLASKSTPSVPAFLNEPDRSWTRFDVIAEEMST